MFDAGPPSEAKFKIDGVGWRRVRVEVSYRVRDEASQRLRTFALETLDEAPHLPRLRKLFTAWRRATPAILLDFAVRALDEIAPAAAT